VVQMDASKTLDILDWEQGLIILTLKVVCKMIETTNKLATDTELSPTKNNQLVKCQPPPALTKIDRNYLKQSPHFNRAYNGHSV